MHLAGSLRYCILAFWATATAVHTGAWAQTVNTPVGELRIGMQEAELSKIFEKPPVDWKLSNGIIYDRDVKIHAGEIYYTVSLTKNGFVYKISVNEFLSNNPKDSSVSEQRFSDQLRAHDAPMHAIS